MLKLPFSWSNCLSLTWVLVLAQTYSVHLSRSLRCSYFSSKIKFHVNRSFCCRSVLDSYCEFSGLFWSLIVNFQIRSGVPFETGKPSDPSLQWLLQWRDGTRQTQVKDSASRQLIWKLHICDWTLWKCLTGGYKIVSAWHCTCTHCTPPAQRIGESAFKNDLGPRWLWL